MLLLYQEESKADVSAFGFSRWGVVRSPMTDMLSEKYLLE